MLLRSCLCVRSKAAYLWRTGIIQRTTAFRWEMDYALNEFTWGKRNA